MFLHCTIPLYRRAVCDFLNKAISVARSSSNWAYPLQSPNNFHPLRITFQLSHRSYSKPAMNSTTSEFQATAGVAPKEMVQVQHLKLNDGNEFPMVGFGVHFWCVTADWDRWDMAQEQPITSPMHLHLWTKSWLLPSSWRSRQATTTSMPLKVCLAPLQTR